MEKYISQDWMWDADVADQREASRVETIFQLIANTFWDLDKYIYQFGQMHFAI